MFVCVYLALFGRYPFHPQVCVCTVSGTGLFWSIKFVCIWHWVVSVVIRSSSSLCVYLTLGFFSRYPFHHFRFMFVSDTGYFGRYSFHRQNCVCIWHWVILVDILFIVRFVWDSDTGVIVKSVYIQMWWRRGGTVRGTTSVLSSLLPPTSPSKSTWRTTTTPPPPGLKAHRTKKLIPYKFL